MKLKLLTLFFVLLSANTFSQGNNWKLNGNNNVSSGDFIGTTNNEPFILKANGNEGLRIKPNGNVRIFSLDDNLTTGLVIANTNGILSKLSLTGNTADVLLGNGTFGNVSLLTGWTIYGNTLSSGYYNVGINTTTAPEKLTVNGNILASGSISGTSLNVIDIVTTGKELKINTSVCLKGIDINDPNSRNELCGMGGDLFIQSEQNSSNHTILNFGNNGNVGIGTNHPAVKFEVAGDARFSGTSQFYRITSLPGDTIIRFGDSTININTSTNTIWGSPLAPGYNRGIGLGSYASVGKGFLSVALGHQSRAYGDYSSSAGYFVWSNAEKAVTIGSGITGNYLINNIPNTLMAGFNSNIPTFFISESPGPNTSGRVGIGTTNPSEKLEVAHSDPTGGMVLNKVGTSPDSKSEIKFSKNGAEKFAIGCDFDNNGSQTFFIWNHVATSAPLLINEQGKVGLGGVIPPLNGSIYKLYVDGGIATRDVKVTNSATWPDYVFKPGYDLMPVADLEKYLVENSHLPGIPSAEDIKKNEGYELGEMQVKLLEKLEEQTLYIIDLQKQLNELKKELEAVKK